MAKAVPLLVLTIALLLGFNALLLKSTNVARRFSEKDDRPDFLLQTFPLAGPITLSTGIRVRTPFHGFDADTNIILGRADHAAVARQVAERSGNSVTVSKTSDGFALALLYLVEYRATAIGPYLEVIYSVVVGPKELACSSTSPTCAAAALINSDDPALTFNVKLWLNESVPVDYGRDILGTDKDLITNGFTVSHNVAGDYHFFVPQVLTAQVHRGDQDGAGQLKAAVSLFSTASRVAHVIGALFLPFVDAPSINPRGIAKNFPEDVNPLMFSRVVNSEVFLTLWDATKGDALSVSHPLLKAINFEPQAIQHYPRCRFLVTAPVN